MITEAVTSLIDVLSDREQKAREKYRDLVRDLAAGKNLDAKRTETIVRDAGKTTADLRADVEAAAELVRLRGVYDRLRAAAERAWAVTADAPQLTAHFGLKFQAALGQLRAALMSVRKAIVYRERPDPFLVGVRQRAEKLLAEHPDAGNLEDFPPAARRGVDPADLPSVARAAEKLRDRREAVTRARAALELLPAAKTPIVDLPATAVLDVFEALTARLGLLEAELKLRAAEIAYGPIIEGDGSRKIAEAA